MRIPFDDLEGSDLIIDCIYEGGKRYKNVKDEPLHVLFPKCGNLGGFRRVDREDRNAYWEDGNKKPAYVVLTTTMSELEWPDYIDEETGIFRYYGDNRKSGRRHTDTKPNGNKLLEHVFGMLNSNESLEDMPPFFVFRSTGTDRDFKFLGLAAPGNPNISPDRDLIAIWRTMEGNRFLNYESYFTILDTGTEPITQDWLKSLIDDHENNLRYAPLVWKNFIAKGRKGIQALKAPRIHQVPSKNDQMNCDREGERCIEIIYNHYKENPFGFEACATELIKNMDTNFVKFELTRPWRDGGMDAFGEYHINSESSANYPLTIEFALEAKCFSPDTGVGVKPMSRLISRIKHRQFGILVTTSYVSKQAYKEVHEDGHPILIITASDIASILRSNGITTNNIEEWLENIDQNVKRLS